MNKLVWDKLNKVLVLIIIVIAFCASLAIMLKYKTEGETNMPFEVKKILIVSSAEAESKKENKENTKWNLNIDQYNDIYINFEKNEEFDQESYIREVTIENINIESPKKGEISIYMPNSTEGKLFSYEDNFKVNESLTYIGATEDNYKALQMANQGGTFLFRVVNRNVSEYVSNDDDEIHYDGTLLKKTNIKLEEIKTKISFDIVIKTNKSTYRGNVSITMPGDDIEEKGVSQTIIEDFSDVVFKRERSL